MPHAPPEFSQSAAAIIGKPLALVNVGFSLELAIEPRTSQTNLPPTSLPPASDAEILSKYKFPIKIGDLERPYDGVVGFWDDDNTTTGATNWDALHTYFHAGMRDGVPITPPAPTPEPGDPRVPIELPTLPTLSPYYIDPESALENDSFARTHNGQLLVKAMIIDPYTPLHVYSPILPITALQLPAWTVQQAMQRICTQPAPPPPPPPPPPGGKPTTLTNAFQRRSSPSAPSSLPATCPPPTTPRTLCPQTRGSRASKPSRTPMRARRRSVCPSRRQAPRAGGCGCSLIPCPHPSASPERRWLGRK